MTAARDSRRGAAVRTFLIGDIRGYTRFTAQHGDEAASRLAATFAEIAQEAVEAWDGDLVELRGDEVLAVFDSARQALRCAIELQDALEDETRTRPELPLTVGIGLDAGEAVPVGDGYRGAALNMAARLCSSAAAGEIIASADLVHLAGPMPGLAFEALPPKELKGIDRPVDAMRVASTVGQARAHALAGPDGGEPLPAELQPIVPLAGRDVELRWLRWHWRRAAHGHGRTVVVSGQPGIGKTRLAAELATVVHADGGSVRYLPSGKGADAEDLLAGDARAPTLLVVDDFDAAPSPLPRAVVALAGRATETPTLLLLTHRVEAAASLTRLVEPLATTERRRTLGPLGPEAIRSIATLYAGRGAEDLPIRDVLDESGGVPAAIHRVAAAWARSSATQRLGASARRTETGRRTLRDAEDELIGDVAQLEQVRERSRRLALDVPSDGVPASPASAITICPYKGLASFDGADAEYFFGRERLVAELVARVVGSPFLGLIGASGSGKSSALRAGLLPALSAGVLPGSDGWRQVVMRPADHPMTELGRALRRAFPDAPFTAEPSAGDVDVALESLAPDQQLLLAIDQFEEVFTATRDDAERSAFLELLTSDRRGLRVVVTMRADHYGDAAPYPALARLLTGSQVLVGPLTGSELAAVIEAPAERVGLRVEPELTSQLVEDAGAEPGVLPLLSTSLLELWQVRQAGWLTLDAYRAGGGLKGAVARLAETALAELDPAQTRIARSIFLRLAGPGEGEGVVRQRVPLSELDADRDPAVARVLDALVAARLLTTGDGYVEVAHEALLREWPRLQGWLEEDAAGRRLRLHLVGAVRDWEQRGREAADLYRGARLSAALDWAAEHQADLNTAEREYLEESRAASQRAVEHERTINRRLRGLLAGAGSLLLVAVAAGGIALLQADTARQQADNAAAQRTLADQRAAEAQAAALDAEHNATAARGAELAAAAVSTLEKDPALSKLLAVAAGALVPVDAEIETSLHRAAAADAIVHRWTWPDANRGMSADLDADGRLMVVSNYFDGPANDIAVIDPATDEELWAVHNDIPGAVFGQALFTPDGTRVVSSLRWSTDSAKDPVPAPPGDSMGVLVWDAKTGRLIRRIDTGPCGTELLGVTDTTAILQPPAAGPGPSCDGPFIKRLAKLDLTTGSQRDLSPELHGEWAMTRDGRLVAYEEDATGDIVVLDVASGKPVFRVDGATLPQRDGIGPRAISDDGTRLIVGDRPMMLINVTSGGVVGPLHAGGESFGGVVFARGGLEVFSVGRDAVLRRWDGANGRLLRTVPTAGGGRPSVSIDGHVLVADAATHSVALVDPIVRGELGTIHFCGSFVPAGSLVVGGDTIAVNTNTCGGSVDGPTTLASAATLKVIASLPDSGGQVLGVSPDGRTVVRQAMDEPWAGPPSLWDGATGKHLRDLEGCRWDTSADKPPFETDPTCREFPGSPFPMWLGGVAWTPDSSRVALVDAAEGYAGVWDPATGELIHAFEQTGPGKPAAVDHLGPIESTVFSPDGRRLIVSGIDGRLAAFDTTTWTEIAHSEPGLRVVLGGFLADGQTLIAISRGDNGGGSLIRIDGASLEVVGSTRAHDGSPKAIALSPDHRLVITGASDGIVRVWDGATGELLHEVQVPDQAQGAAFLDNERIAVAPEGGNVLVFALDRQRLLETVRGTLIRGFTPEECQRFEFAPCPTLEDLRGD